MSLFDLTKNRKRKSTRQLIGVRKIGGHSLETFNQGELVFFILKPHNLAVLSFENITYRLHAMTTILKSAAELGICCMNSRESFEDNKEFFRRRIETEDVDAVKELCRQDIKHLDQIQQEMATAREFVLILRFRREKPTEILHQINSMEKMLKQEGFDVRRAEKADIQRIMAVYFEQNVTHVEFDDADGVRFAEVII